VQRAHKLLNMERQLIQLGPFLIIGQLDNNLNYRICDAILVAQRGEAKKILPRGSAPDKKDEGATCALLAREYHDKEVCGFSFGISPAPRPRVDFQEDPSPR